MTTFMMIMIILGLIIGAMLLNVRAYKRGYTDGATRVIADWRKWMEDSEKLEK